MGCDWLWKKTISIKHTVTQVNVDGKNITVQKDRTKTKSSYRTLPLVPPFEELLRRLKQEQLVNQKVCGAAYCKKYLDYIYVNAMGELVKPNFITQHFEIVLKNHGLKKSVSTISAIAVPAFFTPTVSVWGTSRSGWDIATSERHRIFTPTLIIAARFRQQMRSSHFTRKTPEYRLLGNKKPWTL